MLDYQGFTVHTECVRLDFNLCLWWALAASSCGKRPECRDISHGGHFTLEVYSILHSVLYAKGSREVRACACLTNILSGFE